MRLVVVKALPSVPSEEVAFEGQDMRSMPCDSGGGATWTAETLRGKPGLGEGFGTVTKQTKKRGPALKSTRKNRVRDEGRGLPWWRNGWESTCQCRGHGFEPWSGKIPHAVEQLDLWATITEPARLEPVLRNKRGRDSDRPVHRDEEWPLLAAAGESPRTETKTQHSHKLIN